MTAVVALLLTPAALAGVLPSNVEKHTLDNGLTIYLAPMDAPGVVAWQSWVEVGSANETEPGTTGFAHFFEHLMFYGSEDLPGEMREKQLLHTGADENAWTWFDDTVYHCVVGADALPEIVRIEADRFQNLHLTPEMVEKEAGAVEGEYRKSLSDPWSRTFDTLYEAAFTTHTYRHSTIGYEADILAMPKQHGLATSFFDTHYGPQNVRIVVAGDLDPQATLALIEAHYGDWARSEVERPAPPEEPAQEEARRVEVAWDMGPSNTHLMLGWKVPGFDPADPDAATLAVVSDLLFSDVAPLYRDLVVDRALVLDLSGGDWWQRDPHLFVIATELRDPATLAQVEERILQEIAALAQKPAPPALESVRQHALKQAQVALDTPAAVADLIGTMTRGGLAPEVIDTYYENYAQVDADAVSDLVQRYFVPEGLTLAVLPGTDGEVE